MGRTVILNEVVNTACDIAGSSRNDSDKTLLAKTMRPLPTQGRSATLWAAAAMLAMTWMSETRASPDQAPYLADAQHATAARNLDSVGMAGEGEFEALPLSRRSNDKSVQVAQATTNDTGVLQQSSEQEHPGAETLSCELTVARRDVELLQHLGQEHDRAERLEQDLAAARRDVETQTALATKAGEEASRLKQAGESGAAELQKSLQQERERSARLEQDLAARRGVETALATKADEEASRLKRAGESGAAELQKSLQQERQRAERLEQDLAAARRDVETQTALATKAGEEASRLKQAGEGGTAKLQRSLQQERERSARLEQDLAEARRDVETQGALATKASEEASRLKQAGESGAAELQKSLQQERERSARLEQDLAARRGVETALATKADEEASRLKRAGESGAAELQKSLQQERERSAQLEQDLATARRDVETQTALAAKASEDAARRKQAADASATELRQSMQKEHDRAEALARDLSLARSEVYAYQARASKAGDEAAELRQAVANGAPSLRKSAQDARDRAERLEQDLATARRDRETQTALAAKASEEAAQARQMAERDLAALRSSLQQERARAERIERDLALAQRVATNLVTIGSNARDKPVDESNNPAADQAPAASAQGDAQPNSEEAAVAAGLVARASTLLRQGDIGAARIVLERAVEMGSAQASFSLAETFDPLILAKWGTYGTRGDAIKAQDLYTKADAAGIQEAKARFEALRR
ncbi:hypothetical protein [Bradyrhizobium sp. AZCC 2289]|uniref:hypothetical protein n=1 Tax=Bradyrhizobium sp. AZCC 2289 TaxID=3117026 RepID=UPI002FF1CFF9